MATPSEATARFQLHVQGTENANDPRNLNDSFWMLEHPADVPEFQWEIEPIWNSLTQVFEELNETLNQKPEEFQLTRQLAYAINGLMTHCLTFATSPDHQNTNRQPIFELAWRITVAWDAVLAGDIDSIQEHVENERTTRGIGA